MRKIIFPLILIALVSVCLTGCGKKEEIDKVKTPDTIVEFNDSDVVIGVVDGYIFEDIARRYYPEAQIKVFDSREYAYKALLTGDISGIIDDEPVVRAITRSVDYYKILDGYIERADYSFAFAQNAKGNELKAQFDSYVSDLKSRGELARLDEKWFGDSTDNKVSGTFDTLTGSNGTITFAYDGECIPFEYMSRGRAVGYEIDLMLGFCSRYGYRVKENKIPFTDMLSGVASGNYDMGASAITVTDERSKTLNFGVPSYTGGTVMCVNSNAFLANADSNESDIKRHLIRSFVEEDRYLLILEGLGTTVIIVLFAVLLGNPFGYILYIISRRSNAPIRAITKGFVWLLHGTPAIMIIMILYYKYYMDLSIGGVVASIAGFSLFFGEEIYRIIETYAARIDEGKLEEEYKLWFSKSSDFFHELMSHSRSEMLNDFTEKVVLLIKDTAVVGYIAVNDMTKVFDTIRMDSYEVALPLIVTVVLYVVLIGAVTKILKSFIKKDA